MKRKTGRYCDVLTCGKPATQRINLSAYCDEHAEQIRERMADNKANRANWWERKHNHPKTEREEA
jgi:hypothetical protein